MIRLNDIVVKFGDFTALHGINVHVKEGEFFTFLGPSGCGKTTTLRTITGFIEPVEGAVVVKDRDITHVEPGAGSPQGLMGITYSAFWVRVAQSRLSQSGSFTAALLSAQ